MPGSEHIYPWTSVRGAKIAAKKGRDALCHLNKCLRCQSKQCLGIQWKAPAALSQDQTIFTLSAGSRERH